MLSMFAVLPRAGGATLAVLAIAGCSTPDLRSPPRNTRLESQLSVIPFEWRGNSPLVEVFIGSAGPYRFMVDTGSGHTLVSPACADAARLETTHREGMVGGNVGMTTRRIALTRIPELRLGPASFFGVSAVVDDLSAFGIDGIVGFRAFHDLLLAIDSPRREIRLERGRLPDPKTDPYCLPLAPHDEPVPYVRGRIAGHRALFLIDSGFGGNLFLSRANVISHDLGFEPSSDAVRLRSRLTVTEAEVGRLRELVEIGPFQFDDMPTIVGRGGGVILGGAFLRDRVVTFDQRAQRVRISAPR